MSGLLEKFRAAKADEIARLQAQEAAGELPPFFAGTRPSLYDALSAKGVAVIAEYKRASPSRGEINMGLGPVECARTYQQGGAAAMSVLTEETYFRGELDYLQAIHAATPELPLLRKDFLFHELQVRATASTPASALLLIARMHDHADGTAELARLVMLASAAGIEPVVEVFDEADLTRARAASPRIIQVNSRDLDTLTTDLGRAEALAAHKRPGEVWIAASGIHTSAHVTAMARASYDAVLVGTSIMAAPDPSAQLAALVAAGRQ